MDYVDKIKQLCVTLVILVTIFIILTGTFILKLAELEEENKRLQEEAWSFYYELDDLKQNK
jgi:sensor domain CHASE-containing protein